jgi:hypothetical protein
MASREQPSLCAADSLGGRGRAGCEQQDPEVVNVAGELSWLVCASCLRECAAKRFTLSGWVVSVHEPFGDEDPARQVHLAKCGCELRLVSWLGDDHLEIGVRDVAAEVFSSTRVVESRQRDAGQGCTAQREDVVRCVV